jgi:hypothetical protein
MNTLVKILIYIAKFLNQWFFKIPLKLNILSLFIYIPMMFFVFGATSVEEVKIASREMGIMGHLLSIIFALPVIIAFASFMSFEKIEGVTSVVDNSLQAALVHRNNMMANKSPKEAYQILKDTAHLDVMASNSGNSAFENAKLGFNATVGRHGPTKVYDDLTNKG